MKISNLEAAVLWEYMQDFQERMERFNNNGTILAEFLEEHGFVDRVVHRSGLRSEIGSIIDYTGK